VQGRNFAVLLKEKLKIFSLIKLFPDIRKNPEIPLRDIILSLFLMPFFGLTSLLSLDREARKKQFKKLFGSKRKMVASDSTLKRALSWLSRKMAIVFLLGFLKVFEKEGLSIKKLTQEGPYRRIGIVDGSFMGSHYLVTLNLSGKTDYPAMVEECEKRGKELPAASVLLRNAKKLLGNSFPNLLLFDSLYFNKPHFDLVRKGLGAHLLIKSSDPSFREVLKDADFFFQNKDLVDVPILEKEGFDSVRICSWKIQITSGDFAGYPIQIAHLTEYYPKRKKDKHPEAWIVTTDLSLSPAELREAAHLRWHVENNVFKRISHLSGTKRFYFKDSMPFFNLLRFFFAAIAAYDILLYILKRNEKEFKALLNGIKPTWKNIFSQIAETFEENVFGIEKSGW